MSRFFSQKYAALTPYTPGEQPQDMQYVKLNTNENPFPPSEKALPPAEITKILRSNPDNVVVIDEAYVDFGGESCIPLVHEYENLLVVQTYSKSRSLAGGRLGYAIGNAALIRDLDSLRYSTNPYNVNSATLALGAAILDDEETVRANCAVIAENRAYTTEKLRKLGFEVLASCANFIFARTPAMDGGALYQALKARGVLVRHFTKPEIAQFNRITIGTREQMDTFLENVAAILEENR